MRSIPLAGLALILTAVTVMTWGSIGSAVTAFCLIMMGAAIAYQKFLTNRDDDLWQSE